MVDRSQTVCPQEPMSQICLGTFETIASPQSEILLPTCLLLLMSFAISFVAHRMLEIASVQNHLWLQEWLNLLLGMIGLLLILHFVVVAMTLRIF